jgi:hypothetical protein
VASWSSSTSASSRSSRSAATAVRPSAASVPQHPASKRASDSRQRPSNDEGGQCSADGIWTPAASPAAAAIGDFSSSSQQLQQLFIGRISSIRPFDRHRMLGLHRQSVAAFAHPRCALVLEVVTLQLHPRSSQGFSSRFITSLYFADGFDRLHCGLGMTVARISWTWILIASTLHCSVVAQLPAIRPHQLKGLKGRERRVARPYGGSRCGQCVRQRSVEHANARARV